MRGLAQLCERQQLENMECVAEMENILNIQADYSRALG